MPPDSDDEPMADAWARVSPRYVVVELVGTGIVGLLIAVLLALPALLGWWGAAPLWLALLPAAAVLVWTVIWLVLTPRRVRAIGYRLREDDLLFRRGVLVQRIVAVPYGRMQLVDIARGPLSRALGLADLKFVTAAAATAVSIPGLPIEQAEAVREELVRLAESRRAGL